MKPRKPLQRSQKPIKRSPLRPSTKAIRPRKADPSKRAWAKHRDMKYQAWIKTLRCLICGGRPVDPAHVIKRSRGSDDRKNLVPLCRFPHHFQQEGRTAAFEMDYKVDLTAEALRLDAEYTESE
jgi:hypothetical protein